jgi:hypothetical protein
MIKIRVNQIYFFVLVMADENKNSSNVFNDTQEALSLISTDPTNANTGESFYEVESSTPTVVHTNK